MNLLKIVCLFTMSLSKVVFALSDEKEIRLWSGQAPGERQGEIGKEKTISPKPGASDVLRITNVTIPTMTIYSPESKISNGSAVLVCPGGGYNILAYEHEGTQVCQWLNELGITAILLKYRVPRRANRPKHEAPLQDAQRAIRLIRANAKKWGVDRKKIGILGFSAGGNLAAMALTSFKQNSYAEVDDADKLSCRPDFGVLIYPAYLVDRSKRDQLFPEVVVSAETPPCCFVHTGDDNVPAEGSVLMYLALEKAGFKGNEIHVYPFGGHGYGMRKTANPVSDWPNRVEVWMRSTGWL